MLTMLSPIGRAQLFFNQIVTHDLDFALSTCTFKRNLLRVLLDWIFVHLFLAFYMCTTPAVCGHIQKKRK